MDLSQLQQIIQDLSALKITNGQLTISISFRDKLITLLTSCVTYLLELNESPTVKKKLKRQRKQKFEVRQTDDQCLEKRPKIEELCSIKLEEEEEEEEEDEEEPKFSESINDEYDETVQDRKRSNLKSLIRRVCELSGQKDSVTSDFDILDGQNPQAYGLTRSYAHELCLLLELCPSQYFKQKHALFYSGLFKITPKTLATKVKNYRRWIETGFDKAAAKGLKIGLNSQIIQEVILHQGSFEPFNPFETIIKEEDPLDLNEVQPPNNYPSLGNRVNELFVHDTFNAASLWLKNEIAPNSVVPIPCHKGSYTAYDVYHHKMSLIPDLVVNKVFALLALIVEPNDSVKAKILLRPRCIEEDLNVQMETLFASLNRVSINKHENLIDTVTQVYKMHLYENSSHP